METLTLDDYCFGAGAFPSHMKLDVEGAEELVLRGGRRLLRERPPVIAMEVWFDPPAEAHQRAAALLAEAGYRAHAIMEDGSLGALGPDGLEGHFARLKQRYRVLRDHGPDNLVFCRG